MRSRNMAEEKYIIYKLGEHKYSIKLSKINGIEHVYNLAPVPMGAPFIKGIVHLRNTIIPVYGLKERFGISEKPALYNRQLLVTQTHGMYMAIEVDDVIGIVPVLESNIKAVPNVVRGEETGYMENVIRVTLPETTEEEIILSISIDDIMSDAEFDSVLDSLEQTKNQE
jgi:purine-binding chemotaxis protein CheW